MKIDNRKLQTSPTNPVQVKGKPKRSKKRRGDRRVRKKEKASPRETKRSTGVYKKPGIRTTGKKSEKSAGGVGSPRTTSPSQKVDRVLLHPGTRPKRAVRDNRVAPRSTGARGAAPDVKVNPRTTQRGTNVKELKVQPRTTQRSTAVKDIKIIPRTTHKSNVVKDVQVVPRTTQRSRVVRDIKIVPRQTQRSSTVKDIKIIPRSVHKSGRVKDIKIIPRSVHRSGTVKDIKIIPRTTKRSTVVRDVKIIPRTIHRSNVVKDIKIVPRSIHPSEKVAVLKYPHPGTKRNTKVKDVTIVPRSASGERGLQDPLPQKYGPTKEAHYTGDRRPHIVPYDSRIPNYKGNLKVKKKKEQPDSKVSDYQGNVDITTLTRYNESYVNYRGDNKFFSKKRKTAFYRKSIQKIYAFRGDNKLSKKVKVAKAKPKEGEDSDIPKSTSKQKKAKYGKRQEAHPTSRFDTNENKSVTTKPKNKLKALWYKIFKKKLQPEHLKDKGKTPKHDPEEKDIWNY